MVNPWNVEELIFIIMVQLCVRLFRVKDTQQELNLKKVNNSHTLNLSPFRGFTIPSSYRLHFTGRAPQLRFSPVSNHLPFLRLQSPRHVEELSVNFVVPQLSVNFDRLLPFLRQ